MLQHAERKQLRPGEMLFRHGDALGGFYGLLSVSLKISSLREVGREAIFVLLARGDMAMADDVQPEVPVSQEAQWYCATGASISPVPSAENFERPITLTVCYKNRSYVRKSGMGYRPI